MRPATPFLDSAVDVSRRLRHDYVGTEHLLLALAEDRESASAQALARHGLPADRIRAEILALVGTCEEPPERLDSEALAAIGIDLDEVRRRVEQTFGPDALDHASGGCTPVMPRLKQALELAVRESGDSPLHAARVLLGLASIEDCLAARILTAHGITPTELASFLPANDD